MDQARIEACIELILQQVAPKVIAHKLQMSTSTVVAIKKKYTFTVVRRKHVQLGLFKEAVRED